jgi:hypothetical protein
MSNKDLLKQAIAEAKTIREAAIANAKEALEETLTPHLKEMLAQKLQEMEDKEDEVVEENIYEAEEEEVEAGEGEEGAEEEAGEEEEGNEEEELEIEDMSVEDLKDLIRDIVAQEVGHDESEEELPGEEAPAGEEDMVSMDGDSEEIDINELLAELDEMDKEEVKEENINEMGPEYIEGAAQLVEMFPFLTMQTASLVIGALGAAGLAGFSAIAAKVMDMALAGKFGATGKAFAEKLQAAGGAAAKVTQNREGVEAVNEEENIDENYSNLANIIDGTISHKRLANTVSKHAQAINQLSKRVRELSKLRKDGDAN